MVLPWLKAFHLFFMVAWFAGIFYLPRLFVYHASATDQAVKDTLKTMERRLWWFVLPFAIFTAFTGFAMINEYGNAWAKASTCRTLNCRW